jgi:autotransporter-associated beta strand protein
LRGAIIKRLTRIARAVAGRRKAAQRSAELPKPRRLAHAITLGVLASLYAIHAQAQDATWNGTISGEWTLGANWSSTPIAPTGTATFTTGAATTSVSNNNVVNIGALVFTGVPNAPAYTFSVNRNFAINGVGVVNNSASTQTFTVNNNSVMVFNSGSANSGSGNVVFSVPRGTLEFANSSAAGSTTINATGGLGIIEFFGSANAGHATINAGGLLAEFSGSSTAANATINNSGASQLLFSNSANAGSATINNSNTFAFNTTSSAANATINNTGFLNFEDSSSAGNATINHAAGNKALVFNAVSTAGTAHIINDASFVTFGGFDPIASPTAANATIENKNRGLTDFVRNSTAGNAAIINTASGSTAFGRYDSSFNNGALVDLTKGTGTAGHATIVNSGGGSTIFYHQSTAGTATITNNSGGVLAFFSTSDGSTARVFNNTRGLVDISNATTGTSIGSVEGAGDIYLGSKKLTLGITNIASADIGGVISDCGATGANCVTGAGSTGGSLLKVGTGTLILSGANTYSGATTVTAGTLGVNGSIASSSLTTVNAGATLGGNGTVGNTTINGGTLAPGNSIGTLTVQGNLVFTAAASYMIEVSPADADRTNVTGTATLGGATVKTSFAAGTYVARQYTILNATGGVSGSFNTLANTDLPANFKSSLSYDGNNAYLNLALNFIPPPGSGLNANQQSVANAIVGFFNSNGGIPLVFGGLTPTGLTQISGEVATGTQQTTFNAMNQFMGVMTDPFIAGRGDPVSSSTGATPFADEDGSASAYAADGRPRSKTERDAYAAIYRKAPVMADPFTQRWSVWAAGYGGSQTTDGNTALGSNNMRSSIGGVAVGADYRFSPNTLAGFAIAGGGTSFSVNGLGSGRSDLFQAGAFVSHNFGPAYITAAAAYGWQDVSTDRTVTVAGADLSRANFNANAYSGRVEGGYRLVTPWIDGIGITPYAAGQFITFDLPAYAEQAIAGANTFALTYASKSATDTRSELGVRTDKSFTMQSGIVTLRGRAAWAHDFNPDRNIAATFQTLPGASFVVNGAAQAADSALVTGSAEMKWLNGFSLAATFEGEFSGVTRSYAGKGVARYGW